MNLRAMLLRPLINEKSMVLTKTGVYTFEVAQQTNKPQLAKFIADKFGVEVLSVRTITTVGKKKMQTAKRKYYQLPSTKKALVSIKRGQKIPLFEVAEESKADDTKTEVETKEKKSLLKGTKVKIERVNGKKGKAK